MAAGLSQQKAKLFHYTRILNSGVNGTHPPLIDPETLDQSITEKLRSWYRTHKDTKVIERQFQDFKSFYLDT